MSDVIDRLEERLRGLVGDVDPGSRKGRKRLAILETATERFTAAGYRDTSMEEIAAAVGIAKGTIYLYFPTKFDLLMACTSYEKLTLIPRERELLESSACPADRLRAWIEFMLLTTVNSPLFAGLLERKDEIDELMRESPPDLRAESEAAFVEIVAPLIEATAGPHHRWSAVEIHDRCNVVRGIMHLAPLLRHEWMRPGMSAERFAAILADLIVVGLES